MSKYNLKEMTLQEQKIWEDSKDIIPITKVKPFPKIFNWRPTSSTPEPDLREVRKKKNGLIVRVNK